MDLAYDAALALGRSGAVEELMGNTRTALEAYSRAQTLLVFILSEGPRFRHRERAARRRDEPTDAERETAVALVTPGARRRRRVGRGWIASHRPVSPRRVPGARKDREVRRRDRREAAGVRGDGDALQLGRDSKAAVTFDTPVTGEEKKKKKKLNRRESDDERCTMYPTARTIAGKRNARARAIRPRPRRAKSVPKGRASSTILEKKHRFFHTFKRPATSR